MKKILIFILVLMLLLPIAGCSNQTESKPGDQAQTVVNEPASEPVNDPVNNAANEPTEVSNDEPVETPEPEPEPEMHPLCIEDMVGTWKYSSQEGAKHPMKAQISFSGDSTLYYFGNTRGTTIEGMVPFEIIEEQIVFHANFVDGVAVYDPAEDIVSCSKLFFGHTLKLHRDDSFVLSEEAKPLVGTWEAVSVIIKGNSYTPEEKNLEMTLILKDSGIASIIMDQTEYRQWSFENGIGKIIKKNGETSMEFTVDDEKLILSSGIGGIEYIMEKQN